LPDNHQAGEIFAIWNDNFYGAFSSHICDIRKVKSL